MMENVQLMLSDTRVQLYFLVLGWAVYKSCSSYKSSKSKLGSLPLAASALIVSITWFYILRFILTHLETSESYFDDAYKDVLRTPGHYFTSSQLLTWAIVGVIWIANETEGTIYFLLFGFLGALSAAYTLWVPTLNPSKRSTSSDYKPIPICYLITSLVSFYSILCLKPCESQDHTFCLPDQGFGSFHPNFRLWLQALHILLVVPVFAAYLWPNQPHIDPTILYSFLAICFASWHLQQIGQGLLWTIPITDCQKSITTDLVCCSLITLHYIQKTESSTRKLSLAAIGIPLLSPAAVLAMHLASKSLPSTHRKVVSYLQRQVATTLSGSKNESSNKEGGFTPQWCNLGVWNSSSKSTTNGTMNGPYEQACQELAMTLGKAAELGSQDAVLSCGCGSGAELFLYKEHFQLRHITGIDPEIDTMEEAIRSTWSEDFNIRRVKAGVEDLVQNNSTLFPRGFFNKILALDNIYHYNDKIQFLKDSHSLLPPGGTLAMTDVVVSKDLSPLVKLLLALMGVSTQHLWKEKEYRDHLASLGYVEVTIDCISQSVFGGWAFLPQGLIQHLEYAVIVAKVHTTVEQQKHKTNKKVAIVGSGLAGLSAAHRILGSCVEADVDIYESHSKPGLSGNTILVENQLVDIPARMAAEGYYSAYGDLLRELGLPTLAVRTDCSYYGKDSNGDYVVHRYDRTNLAILRSAVFRYGVRKICQVLSAISDFGQELHDCPRTFGDWLHERFHFPSKSSKDGDKGTKQDFPSLSCRDFPMVYIIVGSLGWMLSCTYEQLFKYPADIIFPYCRGLNLAQLGLFRQGQVVRVNPSIRALERALLYGINKLVCNKFVTDIDNLKVIDGKEYDVVIIATEASAVPKILKNANDVFKKVEYHPSTTCMHKDESFMPPNKSDWCCWNVEMSSGSGEPQLTFWLNEFYPEAKFESNVFQTWSPKHTAKKELIIKGCEFLRVVHSDKTKEIVSEIEQLQGVDGIYFAGSYVVYGMGLLEEAVKSGQQAADMALQMLSKK